MKYKQLFPILLLIIFSTISYGQKLDRFETTILQFEEEDAKNGLHPDAVLFTGSSSIKRWETVKADFAPITVLNRGFGGSTIPEVLHYAERIILPHQPKTIVFYCGENDLSNDDAEAELALTSFKKFSEWMSRHLPETKLFFIAIKPSIKRWHYWPKMQQANSMIENYINQNEKFYFVDVASKMLDNKGVVLQDIFVADDLHLNEKGYQIWEDVLKPYLEKHYAN
jgi:lysophospholipase L1-like esterase